jgi:polysaccharide biosynthesis transport protein
MHQLTPGREREVVVPFDTPKDNEFAKIFDALRRRKKTFWSIFLGFFGICLLYGLFWPKSYTADAQIITGNSAQNFNGLNSDLPVLNALISASGTQSVETYATMLVQKQTAAQVIKDEHLHIDPYSLLTWYTNVQPVTNTQIVDIAITWKTRQSAAAIANDFANVVVNQDRNLVSEQSQMAMDYLSAKMPQAQADMNKADSALAQYQATHTIADINAQTQSTVSLASDIASRYSQVAVDADQARAELGDVQGQLASVNHNINGGSNVAQNPVVTQLSQQLAQVEVELGAARKQYTEAHPTVIALEQQEAQLKKELKGQPTTYVASNTIQPNPVYQQLQQQAASLQSQISGDESQLVTLKGQMSASNTSLAGLPTVAQHIANLQREAQLAEGVYTAMKQRYDEALVAKTMALANIMVSAPAEPQFAQAKPNIFIVLPIGAVLALLLAGSGVFFVDFFDNTLKDENDVLRVLPYPILASVPQLTASGNGRTSAKLPTLRALTIEAYLQLVTALRYSSDKPLRTLAITSPAKGDGKSTVALNTAIAMAEMRPKVLIVDADMRHPTIHEMLGLEVTPGLTDLLIGAAELGDVIHSTKYAGLDAVVSGAMSPNPIKLFQSKRFDEVVQKMLERYDSVVFDTPALLPMFDSTALSAKLDGTVLVVAAGMTDMPSIKRSLQRLGVVEGANIVGVVMNRAVPNIRDSAYFLQTNGHVPLSGDVIVDA